MTRLAALAAVLALAACGTSDRVELVAVAPTSTAAPSPVASGERDRLPVRERVVPTTRASRNRTGGGNAGAASRGSAHGPKNSPAPSASNTARVSWYGSESGSRTANGERFNPDGLTFAHRSMAFGSQVRFCHAGRCVVARCNDRGPAAYTGRSFDLSRGAFQAIAPLGAGVVTVTWAVA